ncbi:hypothetical protein HPB47_004412 [Ixodes persulcatus]|uniref:Uncharacterized protein n=1 Tax=Ixodes persulcatus TaxID=34615 RepID=A0AC60PGD7_IXOPE|nr:hypothetical protein HPB47_004412 [Ixodes persulcatus]
MVLAATARRQNHGGQNNLVQRGKDETYIEFQAPPRGAAETRPSGSRAELTLSKKADSTTGRNDYRLTPLVEAVLAVIGIRSSNLLGIEEGIDTDRLVLQLLCHALKGLCHAVKGLCQWRKDRLSLRQQLLLLKGDQYHRADDDRDPVVHDQSDAPAHRPQTFSEVVARAERLQFPPCIAAVVVQSNWLVGEEVHQRKSSDGLNQDHGKGIHAP